MQENFLTEMKADVGDSKDLFWIRSLSIFGIAQKRDPIEEN